MKTKIADILIDKELEIIQAKSISNPELQATHETIETDTNLGLFGKEDWFTYYTFKTEKQYLEWKNFCLKKCKKEEFTFLDFMFGLKKEFKM